MPLIPILREWEGSRRVKRVRRPAACTKYLLIAAFGIKVRVLQAVPEMVVLLIRHFLLRRLRCFRTGHLNQYTMRRFLLLLIAILPLLAQAQLTSTFENQPLPTADTYYVNYTAPGTDVGFNDGSVHYPCVYDTGWGAEFWSYGFAYSNMTDSVTSGYGNQYSAKAGKGHAGSDKYVVAYGGVNSIRQTLTNPWLNLYITNTTYAYNSMRNGDAFSKKFGGVSGNDSDWFKVTIHGYKNGIVRPDSIEFYLADFRFTNNAQDYIVRDWRVVNLAKLATADSLVFALSSSDNGSFGMNTPAYFCLDDVAMYTLGVEHKAFSEVASISPNPVVNYLQVDVKDVSAKSAAIVDITGRTVATVPVSSQRVIVNTSTLPAGQYLLRLDGAKGTVTTRFIKQ
jgi:hypothetical protein